MAKDDAMYYHPIPPEGEPVGKLVWLYNPPEGTANVPEWVTTVDWFQPVADVAREAGISRQRVHEVRRRLNIPTFEWMVKDWLKESGATNTLADLATLTGLSRRTISRYLRDLGIEPVPTPQDTGPRPQAWKYDWDAVDWSKSDTEIAKELGVVAAQVHQARSRQNRPPNPKAKPRKAKQADHGANA